MNNPFNFFDKTYCINLPERTDRWEICESNFRNFEILNFKRFNGIKPNLNIPSKRAGQIGCALSFCNIFYEAMLNDYSSVLIFEDDFSFTYEKEVLFEKLNASINELPKNWDVFYLGANIIDELYENPIENYSNNLLRIKSAYALHSVAFSKEGILKFINYFEDNIKPWHINLIEKYEAIDVFMAHKYQMNNLCLMPKELLCHQRPSFSTIEQCQMDYRFILNGNLNKFMKKISL